MFNGLSKKYVKIKPVKKSDLTIIASESIEEGSMLLVGTPNGNDLNWSDIVNAWQRVEANGYRPNIAIIDEGHRQFLMEWAQNE